MTAPVLAEGVLTFEDRAGGAYVVVTFANGASLVISRGELYNAGRLMRAHAVEKFEQQRAEVLPFEKARGAHR